MDLEMMEMRSFLDERGVLSVGELNQELPFPVQRIYYIYGVPSKSIRRGYHSHKKLRQVFICMHGSCKLLFDDGVEKKTISLDKPDQAVYVGPGIWREMFDFTSDAVLMVLASDVYDESDYIRNYDDFLKSKTMIA